MKGIKRTLAALLVTTLMLLSFTGAAFAQGAETPFDNSRFFTYGDYDVHYRVFEPKGERVGRVMMLHGFGCSTYSWEPMARELTAEGYECVLADLPGFGYSTREVGDIELVARETLIEELMKSIAPMKEWILAGHSMGGGVAMNIAAETPELKALLLYCPAPVNEVPGFIEPLMNNSLVGGLMSAVLKYGSKITPLMRIILLAAFVDWEFSMDYDIPAVADPLALSGTGASLMGMMFNARATDLDKVVACEMPMLLVEAQYDMVLTPSMKRDVTEALVGAQLYTVSRGGHMCIENRSAELGAVTLDFLSENGL